MRKNTSKPFVPGSPLVHTLRSGKSFSANKHTQDIRKFMSPLAGPASLATSSSIQSHITISSSSSRTSSVCTVVPELQIAEPSYVPAPPPSRKQPSRQTRSSKRSNHLEAEGIEFEDESSNDVIYVKTISSPRKVAKFTEDEEAPISERSPTPERPPKSAVKAESATPPKSKPAKPTGKSTRKSTKEVMVRTGPSAATRSKNASGGSSERCTSSMTSGSKSNSPPKLTIVSKALEKKVSLSEKVSVAKTSPVRSMSGPSKTECFEPVYPETDKKTSEKLPTVKYSEPVCTALETMASSSGEIASEKARLSGSAVLGPDPVSLNKEMVHPVAAKKHAPKRKLKRLQKDAKIKPASTRPKTHFDYMRLYNRSKFVLTYKNLPPLGEIVKAFSPKNRNNGGKRVPSLFDLALRKFFQATIIKKRSTSKALFSNKVELEILPKMNKFSPAIRRKPSLVANVIKLLVLVAADRRTNIHLLKQIFSFLSNLIGIGHGPTVHALVERKLSRHLPSLLRLFRVDWQGVLRIVKFILFKDKLAFRQTGCVLLFDRLKSLIRPKNAIDTENLLESNDKLHLSHLTALLSADPNTNFVELEPPSRAYGVVRILQTLADHFDQTRDMDGDEMARFFEVIRACRMSNKQSIRGYAESSKIVPATQLIADEWEEFYEKVAGMAIDSNCRSFTAGGYESAVMSRTPLNPEQRRVFVVYESDPESEESYESYEEEDALETSRNDRFDDSTLLADSPKAAPCGRTSTAKKVVKIDPSIPFSPIGSLSHSAGQVSPSNDLNAKAATRRISRPVQSATSSPDENNSLPAI